MQQGSRSVHKHRPSHTADQKTCLASVNLSGKQLLSHFNPPLKPQMFLDVRLDAVQQPRSHDVRRDSARNRHPRKGFDSSTSIAVDGQVAAASALANTEDERDRAIERVYCQRWIFLQASQVSFNCDFYKDFY